MTDTRPVTIAQVRVSKWSLRVHMRLGRGGFMRTVGCEEFPRFTINDGRATFREPIKRQFLVDGIECTTLADVVERLNTPPGPAQKELL